jgi:hypothetical protein
MVYVGRSPFVWMITAAMAAGCGTSNGSSGAGGSGSCLKDGDCAMGMACSPGGAPITVGGAVQQPNCNVDSDCNPPDAGTANHICTPITCPGCALSGLCEPGCQAGSCGTNEMCASTGHCVPKPCTTNADCPNVGNYVYACSSSVCAGKVCSSDADCGADFCVDGYCHTVAGQCVQVMLAP